MESFIGYDESPFIYKGLHNYKFIAYNNTNFINY
jgi:hypothetical protein